LWFIVSSVTVVIDLTFVLGRPATLQATTPPYVWWVLYTKHDKRYGDMKDGWVVAQSWLNALEVAFQLIAVLASLLKINQFANKLALVVSTMTLYKTVIYFLIEYFEDYKFTKHNSEKDLMLMVVIPSGVWIVMSAIVALQSWAKLRLGERVAFSYQSKRKGQ
jgi:hypothetical protein